MGRVLCFSDIHGEIGLFKQIQDFLLADDICYVLGDCLDRGEHGISIIKEIMKDARFKMIRGNHEQMLLDQLRDIDEGFVDFYYYFQYGGLPTWTEWSLLSQEEQSSIRSFLSSLPYKATYKDFVLSHAGYDFRLEEPSEEILLWDRSHIEEPHCPADGKTIQVHGHTPTQTLREDKLGRVTAYCKGHKIVIDCGAPYGKEIGLLDLDTLKVTYFKEEK